jgi:hypothetical protein
VLKADDDGSLSVLTDPPVSGAVVVCGDSGAIGDGEVIGVPIAEGGGGVAVVCGAVGVVSFGAAFDD